jgi:hypothetical protein
LEAGWSSELLWTFLGKEYNQVVLLEFEPRKVHPVAESEYSQENGPEKPNSWEIKKNDLNLLRIFILFINSAHMNLQKGTATVPQFQEQKMKLHFDPITVHRFVALHESDGSMASSV